MRNLKIYLSMVSGSLKIANDTPYGLGAFEKYDGTVWKIRINLLGNSHTMSRLNHMNKI